MLDVVLSSGIAEATIASGHRHTNERFQQLGFHRECWGRPVRLLDLVRDEQTWEVVDRPSGGPLRLSGTVAAAGCRIALTPLSALRGWGGMPSSSRMMLEAIHLEDRPTSQVEPILRGWPDLSIVEGPIGLLGRSVVAIAGLDPLAVDTVAAELLGTGSRWADRLDAYSRHVGGVCDLRKVLLRGDAVGSLRPLESRTELVGQAGMRRDAGHSDQGGTS